MTCRRFRAETDLALLRTEYPRDLDVTARVLARIRALEQPDRLDMPASQLGWAGAVAVLGGMMLVGVLQDTMPDLLRIGRELTIAASSLRGAVAPLASAVAGIASATLTLIGSATASVLDLSARVAELRPVAMAASASAVMAMVGTIGYVVGRDLIRIATAQNGVPPEIGP